MKRYNKPVTEIHNIELQSMIAATTPAAPAVQNIGAQITGEYYDDAKQTNLPISSLWDEEE